MLSVEFRHLNDVEFRHSVLIEWFPVLFVGRGSCWSRARTEGRGEKRAATETWQGQEKDTLWSAWGKGLILNL